VVVPVLALVALVLVVGPPVVLRAMWTDRAKLAAYASASLVALAAAGATLAFAGAMVAIRSTRPDEVASNVVVVLGLGLPTVALPVAVAAGTLAVLVVTIARGSATPPPADRLPGPTAAPTI
jgi:hypothetical protein